MAATISTLSTHVVVHHPHTFTISPCSSLCPPQSGVTQVMVVPLYGKRATGRGAEEEEEDGLVDSEGMVSLILCHEMHSTESNSNYRLMTQERLYAGFAVCPGQQVTVTHTCSLTVEMTSCVCHNAALGPRGRCWGRSGWYWLRIPPEVWVRAVSGCAAGRAGWQVGPGLGCLPWMCMRCTCHLLSYWL
jgi:hypothetical protein